MLQSWYQKTAQSVGEHVVIIFVTQIVTPLIKALGACNYKKNGTNKHDKTQFFFAKF